MAGPDLTRARLLEAAGEEFAVKGFQAARIRSICRRAGVNLAAVNYHFGGKERLYVAAVLEAHRCGTELPAPAELSQGSAAEQLRRYIHYFLSDVLAMNHQKRSWHHTLMLREMLQPTAASETPFNEAIRPRFERLKEILSQICPEADELRLDALVCSVVGQCLHYKVAGAIVERLVGAEAFAALDLDYLTDHISGFCLAALGEAPPLNAAGVTAVGGAVAAGEA
jgi:AcrR family transcriptional regulator